MATEGDDRSRSFTVKDRRRFSESGAVPSQTEAADDREQHDPAGTPGAESAESRSSPASPSSPEITFYTFVISLSTQALALLGEMPHPVDGATGVDLVGARQIIDILAMLRDKTNGNLDPEEQRLLEHALYDLRMKYVERARKS